MIFFILIFKRFIKYNIPTEKPVLLLTLSIYAIRTGKVSPIRLVGKISNANDIHDVIINEDPAKSVATHDINFRLNNPYIPIINSLNPKITK